MGCFSVIVGFVLLVVGTVLLLGGFLGTALAVCLAAFRGLMEALAALLRVLF